MPTREKGAITGIGETPYTSASGKSSLALQLEASLMAIADAGLVPGDIDGLITYSTAQESAEDFVVNFGLEELRFSATVPMGGASCVGAVQCAVAVISAGICRHVLIPVGRNGRSGSRANARALGLPQFRVVREFEMPVGAIAPVQFYAPMARRHMELYGTTSRQLGAIAVAARCHASLNENAVMKKAMSIEDHQSSPMVCDPLRLFDCCIESDGGAAIVVSSAERAADAPARPVYVMGTAVGYVDSPQAISQRADLTTLGLAKAAPRAFAMAGVSHADIDIAEIYDCFTYVALCQIEDLGFCKKGEGGPFVESAGIGIGGRLPVNTHGGLLSQAHMLGMNHIVELVRQLRGAAGVRQVAGAEVGLVTGYGDMGNGAIAIMRQG